MIRIQLMTMVILIQLTIVTHTFKVTRYIGKTPISIENKQDYKLILRKLILKSEGISLKPYKCPAGYWTDGIGNLIKDTNHIRIKTYKEVINDFNNNIDRARKYIISTHTGISEEQILACTWLIFIYGDSKYRDLGMEDVVNKDKDIKYILQFDHYKDVTGTWIKSKHLNNTLNTIVKLYNGKLLKLEYERKE